MKIKILKERKLEEKMMRDAYASTLMEIARKDERVVVLDADLMSSMGMVPFGEAFPERTFNVGVQEANMVGVAAGLSATGRIPFAHSFGPFATRKAYDAAFISGAYARLNVRIVGSDPGITAAYNGGTHMPFEDMGIMRNIPAMTVLEPVDSVMLKDLLYQMVELKGMFYVRLLRKFPVQIYENGSSFDIGKGVVLREGSDVTIISSGILVDESLKAAESLEKKGVSARVVNIFAIKPVDRELIQKCARETGAVVTCENHNIINGLGSAVAETLVETCPVPMERIGSRDQFGEVGSVEYLMNRYEMGSGDIEKKAMEVLKRK
ncbi:MAG TPA: transketolase family protein [Spirochaetes bacterium]|nr:transketolase family protein [Spirochaetota bacterium]